MSSLGFKITPGMLHHAFHWESNNAQLARDYNGLLFLSTWSVGLPCARHGPTAARRLLNTSSAEIAACHRLDVHRSSLVKFAQKTVLSKIPLTAAVRPSLSVGPGWWQWTQPAKGKAAQLNAFRRCMKLVRLSGCLGLRCGNFGVDRQSDKLLVHATPPWCSRLGTF